MKTLKRNRLRQLVLWGYITQSEANQMWRDYLRLFKRVTAAELSGQRRRSGMFIAVPEDREYRQCMAVFNGQHIQ